MSLIDLGREDRLAVAVLCLAPVQRSRLEWIVQAGRPVSPVDVARAVGGNCGPVYRQMVDLFVAGLLSRSRSVSFDRYAPEDGVPALLRRLTSIGKERSHLDPKVGLAVLGATRAMVSRGQLPSRDRLEAEIGKRSSAVCVWVARLEAAGLLRGIERPAAETGGRSDAAIRRRRGRPGGGGGGTATAGATVKGAGEVGVQIGVQIQLVDVRSDARAASAELRLALERGGVGR